MLPLTLSLYVFQQGARKGAVRAQKEGTEAQNLPPQGTFAHPTSSLSLVGMTCPGPKRRQLLLSDQNSMHGVYSSAYLNGYSNVYFNAYSRTLTYIRTCISNCYRAFKLVFDHALLHQNRNVFFWHFTTTCTHILRHSYRYYNAHSTSVQTFIATCIPTHSNACSRMFT